MQIGALSLNFGAGATQTEGPLSLLLWDCQKFFLA